LVYSDVRQIQNLIPGTQIGVGNWALVHGGEGEGLGMKLLQGFFEVSGSITEGVTCLQVPSWA